MGTRQAGVDYRTGPQMLLAWGKKKFTEEPDLAAVIESLARAGWLVLDGSHRVHEEPGFGRCLKLREEETAKFWQLVRLWRGEPAEPSAASALLDEAHHPEDSPEKEAPAASEVSVEPDWVREVTAMLAADGAVDYGQVKNLIAERTGRKQGILMLVGQYFEVDDEEGKLLVMSRKN